MIREHRRLERRLLPVFFLVLFCMSSDMSATMPTTIRRIHNFVPGEWEHVFVNEVKIAEFAQELLKKENIELADWSQIVPQDLTLMETVDYILGLIAIDFCHWDLKLNRVRNFYAFDEENNLVRGSVAMTALAKKAYHGGVKIFEAAYMSQVTVKDLEPIFMGFDHEYNQMVIPQLVERVVIMNQIGRILLEKWNGSFYFMLLAAQARAFNEGQGFVEQLVGNFPRFKDEYIYKNKKVGIYKLAQLAVMALESALRDHKQYVHFKDCDALTLCADYQLPRSLRALVQFNKSLCR